MAAIVAQDEQPISRTYQYRKVMKPMLERKRRARINRCLDELKELLVVALQAEGESVSRLEKADVLELTVRHLHKLRRAQQLTESGANDQFKSGFVRCANEVSKYMSSLSSSVDISVSSRLLSHLDGCIRSQYEPHHGSSGALMSPVSSSSGLNILTSYTPPASPISSPKNLSTAAAQQQQLASSSVHPAHPHHNNMSVSVNSQLNLLNLSHAKLFAYLPPNQVSVAVGAGCGSPNSISSMTTVALSPTPAHHVSPANSLSADGFHHPSKMYRPRTNSSPIDEEPFDLSNNVWRPW